jgi:hypothetical protein
MPPWPPCPWLTLRRHTDWGSRCFDGRTRARRPLYVVTLTVQVQREMQRDRPLGSSGRCGDKGREEAWSECRIEVTSVWAVWLANGAAVLLGGVQQRNLCHAGGHLGWRSGLSLLRGGGEGESGCRERSGAGDWACCAYR